ncbi:M56 family metallopeptidase [Poritiphilus flavus]|uniref:TonB family protein n=1 Tax=Poritiphilus flavus TaxID=2697053 RepID=A0A6L9E751_9FLAO|nr:M56 family metallopeptidase [Poritiphilus flavus]NAS10458.1 TonB family protein [Poritiphilus flavus]
MIQNIIASLLFQSAFLMLYDIFLRRETFFKWNRFYLIGSYILSMVLPLVKIEIFNAVVPKRVLSYSAYLFDMDPFSDIQLSGNQAANGELPIWDLILFSGMVVAAFWFGYKLYRLRKLRSAGQVHHFRGFTKILIPDTNQAFSFFRSVYIGDQIPQNKHRSIIQHELVHIREKHSLDLLFFELMRIPAWFNPFVYIYQKRISELHEYIADDSVVKTNKKEHYLQLLSEVFDVENISLINQFSKSSLIKKRIDMLQKTKSKSIRQLKYLLLLPLISSMLLYSSCESSEKTDLDPEISVQDVQNLNQEEEKEVFKTLKSLSTASNEWSLTITDKENTMKFLPASGDAFITGPNNERIKARKVFGPSIEFSSANISPDVVPFGLVYEVPVFPGCENAQDKRTCFLEMIMEHINQNFNYPKEAEEQQIEGRVNVIFTIDQNGMITDIQKRGPHALLEAEAVRIISLLPEMSPGKDKGKNVSVPFSFPLTFKLDKT